MQLGLCIEMAFSNMPFEERVKVAARVGYKNVEMWFVDGSFKGTAQELARLAAESGVKITNTVIGSPDGSIGGGLTDPGHRAQWLERARMTIEFTRQARIPATIVCTANKVAGMTDLQMRQSVLDGLRPTVKMAEKAGVTLLLEALNDRHDHPGYWLTGSDRAAEICREIGSPRMKVLFDCYHMQIMEGNLADHIEKNLDVIGHFHAAGVPGRNEVYAGEMNYPFLLERIKQLGYKGVFALEYAPSIDAETSLRKTLQAIGPLMDH